MFLVGGTPALLVAFIRWGVAESSRWENRLKEVGSDWKMSKAFAALFRRSFAAELCSTQSTCSFR